MHQPITDSRFQSLHHCFETIVILSFNQRDMGGYISLLQLTFKLVVLHPSQNFKIFSFLSNLCYNYLVYISALLYCQKTLQAESFVVSSFF